MFHRALRSVAMTCLVAIWIAAASSATAAQRIALVIGNGAYPSSPLRNSVNDANAIAAKLRALGFEVILRTNASQREMSRSIAEFGRKLTLGSTGLFYFAGHGVQVRGRNFLIPVDAEIESEAAVRGESIDVEQVLDQLGPAQSSIVILDACRNNPFETRFRRTAAGLAQIDAPTGSILAYATAPGKVASDGTGTNGLYTSALLKALDVEGLKIEDVFKQIRNEVIRESANQQIPWESSSLTTEFYFKPGTTTQIESVLLQQSERERAALLKEMETLRNELLQFKASSGEPSKSSTQTAQPGVASSAATTPGTPQPARVEAATAAMPPNAETWSQSITQLEKHRGQLTYSKALALLLNVEKDAELALLLLHEATIKQMSWHSAYAIGVAANGDIVWGGGRSWRTAGFAADTAVQFCAGTAARSCMVIVENGQFNEKNFIEAARQLGGQRIDSTRDAYLKTLTVAPNEVRVSYPAGGGGGQASYGFSSPR